MLLSRREFGAIAGLTAAAIGTRRLGFGRTGRTEIPDVAAIDRHRILLAANRYLHERPITITNFSSPRSPAGTHDYFSEGDYWWPNPKDPSGPYIRRDGFSNPDNFTAHRHALIRLSLQVPALAAAWLLTRDSRYAAQAVEHLRAWFINPATLMNPNLQYAQAIHGITTGRGIGIIDTIHLVEVVRSIPFLERSRQISPADADTVRKWFSDYLAWMTTSKNGQQERDAKNNHGTCWVMQAAEFASYTANQELITFCRQRFQTVLVPNQIAANGSFPLELRRTKPYGYCLFNLDAMATVCQILSSPSDSLFSFALPDGRGFAKAMTFMFPYIADRGRWPYPHDVEYFQDWPVRQPSLLFAGIALSRPQYFPVWRRLNPDPTVEEIIRNYPIRQPLLWVCKETHS
ncbi:MAG TPA: alginate lyase family protein [Candidatus Acidoferrales bacterium]|nr:alginate lyase family protein [Candidatus Acidoferrales bacterium]